MRSFKLVRRLMLASALSALATGCGDDPVVGGDARLDTAADQVLPNDQVPPTDQPGVDEIGRAHV